MSCHECKQNQPCLSPLLPPPPAPLWLTFKIRNPNIIQCNRIADIKYRDRHAVFVFVAFLMSVNSNCMRFHANVTHLDLFWIESPLSIRSPFCESDEMAFDVYACNVHCYLRYDSFERDTNSDRSTVLINYYLIFIHQMLSHSQSHIVRRLEC